MQKRSLGFLALCLGFLGGVGCGDASDGQQETKREADGDSGSFHFLLDTDQPISQGKNDFHLSLSSISTKTPLPGAMVSVAARMPAMAHDAASADAVDAGGGEYDVSSLAFSMAGRWVVRVEATLDMTSDETTFTYDIP